MGLLTAVGLFPHLLFSLPAGVWLDRVRERRRLMVWADIGRALLIGSIPVAYVAGTLSMPQLYVVGFLSGSLAVVFDLSWNTLFVAVTTRDRYVEAMALLNGSRSLASVGGPTIGGLLVQVLGAPLAMLADALSFLGSVFFLRRVRSPEPPIEAEPGSVRAQLEAGLRFVLGDSIMRPTLLSVATINLFTFASSALFILYATTLLGVSPGALGLALGTGAVGSVIGALVATRIGRRIGLGPAYALGCLIFPVSLLLIPLAAPDMPMPLILALLFGSEFGAGFGVMILDINVGAIIYARTPDRIRARAGGAFRFVNYGVRPIGALLGGFLGDRLGVREAIWIATILAIGGVLFLVGSPVLRLRELPSEGGSGEGGSGEDGSGESGSSADGSGRSASDVA
jgi:MFS family permease